MKRKIIISSVLVIALCLSLIAGSTFALFTSDATINMAVTAAKVNVVAEAGEIILYSLDVEQDRIAADETGYFENLGSAIYDSATGAITLTNVTPGDKIEFPITVTNNSNVTIQYRITWVVEGELLPALVATAEGAALVNGTTGWTVWTTADPTTKTIPVVVELPVEVGNEYQEKTAAITFRVEAVQGNGTALYEPPVNNVTDLKAALVAGGNVTLDGDITIAEGEQISVPAGSTAVLDLNNYTISSANAKDDVAIVNNGNLTITGGTIKNTAENGGAVISNAGTLVLDGVTVVGAPMGATGYPEYAVATTGDLTIEAGTVISADRGALAIRGNANVVINGGTLSVSNAADGRILTEHTIYAAGSSTLTINDGEFVNNYNADGNTGASVICPAGATINIYGGTFTYAGTVGQSGVFQNYMGYGKPVNVYGGTYSDNTVVKNLAAGYTATENGGVYVVTAP